MSAFRALIICNSYRQTQESAANTLPELAGPPSDAKNVEAWLWKCVGGRSTPSVDIIVRNDADAETMKMEIEGLADHLESLGQKPLVRCLARLQAIHSSSLHCSY
jgi:hypothetical protein